MSGVFCHIIDGYCFDHIGTCAHCEERARWLKEMERQSRRWRNE